MIDDLISKMRQLEAEHEPEGYPQMKDISALCDAVESAIPALDLLQARLSQGAKLEHQGGKWWLFDSDSDGICWGLTLRTMIISLIFVDG